MAQVPSNFVQDDCSIPYTPEAAVVAGDVVVVGSTLVTIAKLDIPAGKLGNVVTDDIFEVPKVTGAVTGFQKLYYDADADPVGGTAGTGAFTTNSALGPFAGWADQDGAASGDETVTLILRSADSPTTVTRANLGQDDLKPYPIDLVEMRVHDARQTNLPGTAANDDMGVITGTPGTDAPTLQGVDFGGTSTDEKCAFSFALPPEYVSGETITLRVKAAMLTTVSDGTATVDAEVFARDGDGAVGADICATAAQSINSLTPANKDFTITPTSRVAGDVLEVRLSFGGSDTGNVGVMIPEISDVRMLLDIKG